MPVMRTPAAQPPVSPLEARPAAAPADVVVSEGAGGAWPLRLAVFASGTATMALQMCAVRLLAPWVGASSLVWATIIGLSLLAMSLGYLLGGRRADARADGASLARTLLAAAVLVGAVPVVAPVLLPHADLGIDAAPTASMAGAAVGFGVLFFAPALLLGATPPMAIRLAISRVDGAGRTAGQLYALSTLGSIVGTLLAALVLVQWIGTRATLGGIAVLLLAGALGARRVTAVARADVPEVRPRPTAGGAVIPISLASAIVLVEGMAMMATELGIARLVAPFYGASHVVWANVIAIVMGCIALGSWLGGRMADRRPTRAALSVLVAATAAAVAALPFVASPVMRLSTGGIEDVAVGTVVGSFLATMAVLVVPVTLLGMIPPWTLRLALPAIDRAGRTAGRLYALSTAGALVGTFASALWLVPAIGARRALLAFAGALALLALGTALAGGRHASRRSILVAAAAPVLVALLLLAPTGLVKPLDDARVRDERESRYQFVQVVEGSSGRRVLQLNEGWAVHSVYDPGTVLTGGIWDHFLVLPALIDGPARRMLVIGDAAGTSRRALRELRPQLDVEGVELDPEVTAVGRRWFDLRGSVHAGDGRPFLAHAAGQRWDVIHVDAYRQPYIPFYLATREFFELARRRLEPGGVLSINVGSAPSDPRINEAVAASMRAVFPFVARYRAETYNEVIVAVDDPATTIASLAARIRAGELRGADRAQQARLHQLFEGFAGGMRQVQADPDRVLTDDRAPVEWMTDRMILGEAGAGSTAG